VNNRHSENGQRPSAQVAVVVPMSSRPWLTDDEKISLAHLIHYLGRYDKYLVVPQSMTIHIPGFGLERFNDHYFGSAAANTRLMLSTGFYERFRHYEYILIYHLDALVFADELETWCAAGFDYIGPPWQITDDTPWVKEPGVGNGGFSLRHVANCLNVLTSSRYALSPDEYWQKVSASRSWADKAWRLPNKYLKYWKRYNNVQREIAGYKKNEDLFWATRASHYCPGFKIAPVETALRFAFEATPRQSYAQIGDQLPFGCHAWPRYDRAFWEPYLLSAVEPAL
jgi:hypothetical protein